MDKTLLTAFEPYGSSECNISKEVLQRIDLSVVGNVSKLILPVNYSEAPRILRDAIQHERPDRVLMLGQSAQGDNVRLERFAINMMDSKMGDDEGFCPQEQPIYEGYPLALQTQIPLRSVGARCSAMDYSVAISNSAGLYVCNRCYYEALFVGANALFIHIPRNFNIEKAVEIVTKIMQIVDCRG